MARSFGRNESENSPACESNGSDEENVPGKIIKYYFKHYYFIT